MPKIVRDYANAENLRNKFVVDQLDSSDPELQRLNELNKVKLEIQRSKKALKVKNFDAKHPEIARLKENVAKTTVPIKLKEPAKQAPEPEPEPTKAPAEKEPEPAAKTEKFQKAIDNMAGPKKIVGSGLNGRWF